MRPRHGVEAILFAVAIHPAIVPPPDVKKLRRPMVRDHWTLPPIACVGTC